MVVSRVNDQPKTMTFGQWWDEDGSGIVPIGNEDQEEHTRRVAEVAWIMSPAQSPAVHTDYCLSFSDLRNLVCGDSVGLSKHYSASIPHNVIGEFLQAKPDRMLGQELLDAFRKLRFLVAEHIDDTEKLLNEIDCGGIGIDDLQRLQTIVDRLCAISGVLDPHAHTSRRKAI